MTARGRLAVAFMTLVTIAGGVGYGSAAEPAQPRIDSMQQAVVEGRLDPEVAAQMRAVGSALGFIVFEHADVLARAASVAPAGAGRTEAILSITRPAYREMKQRALGEIGAGVSVIHDYDALAGMFVRFRSEKALLAAVNATGVTGVGAEGTLRAGLAQSLAQIRQPQAVQMLHLGAGTSVAVLDTGVDFTRAAFGSCTAPGQPSACRVPFAQDFTDANGDGVPEDDGMRDDAAQNNHGTNVAGIVAGVAGKTKILALDVFRGASAFWSDIAAALNWTVSNQAAYGIRAANMSIFLQFSYNLAECSSGTDVLQMAFANARAVGILPVTISGNSAFQDTTNDGVANPTYRDGISYPSCLPGVVRVGAVYDADLGSRSFGVSPNRCTDATTSIDKVACFSQSGTLLTTLAPGSAITAAGITLSGTSMAAPHVAGAVAVLAAANPGWTIQQIQSRIAGTGPRIADPRTGLEKRRLDLEAALAVDFESPKLGEFDARRVVNPYEASGVRFAAVSGAVQDEVVGVVRNGATWACVDPPSLDQKLGTGRSSDADAGGIGRYGFPIRASFLSPVTLVGSSLLLLGAELQAQLGVTLRIRLYDIRSREVASATKVAGPAAGSCGYHGGHRAKTRVTVKSPKNVTVAYAMLDVVESGRVFVIDNFAYAVI